MNTQSLDRFLEIKQQIKELEEELTNLKLEVIDEVEQAGGKVKYGNVVLRNYVSKSWNFSEGVQVLQQQLREKKKEEINEGLATLKKQTRFVTVSPVKKEDSPF